MTALAARRPGSLVVPEAVMASAVRAAVHELPATTAIGDPAAIARPVVEAVLDVLLAELIDEHPPGAWERGDVIPPGEAAALLGVHPKTLARYADAGRVACQWTPGGERRYSRVLLAAQAKGR